MAQAAKPGEDAVVSFTDRLPAVVLRTDAFPELDFQIWFADPATSPQVLEDTLRKFVKDRVKRAG